MKDLSDKNILMLSPKFFGYEKEIQRALKLLGAQVTWFDERPSNSFLTKVTIRLNKKIIRRKIERYYEDILRQLILKKSRFDYLLIISPEALSAELLNRFRSNFKEAKFIIYMWDSLANKEALELLPLADKVLTFDANDAIKYNLIFRPLFYTDSYKFSNRKYLYDLLFIGTAHSDRYDLVKRLLLQLPSDFGVKTYFFLSSRTLYWTKKIFDPDFRRIKYSDVSFTALSHSENSNLMHGAKIILDINHPKQSGLTMRTLETLGAQKKLITTNLNIVDYDFYDPNNIFVLDRKEPFIPIEFLINEFNPSSPFILSKYSINGWIEELFL